MLGLPQSRARWTSMALGTALLVAMVSACSSSSPEREYATPRDLCGTRMSAASLAPVLSPGKKISELPTSGVGVKRCRLQVDGDVVFSSSVEKRAADASAWDVAMSAIGVDPTDSKADNGRFIYSKTGAVGQVECKDSAETDYSIWVTARATHAPTAASMLRFTEEYATAVARLGACSKQYLKPHLPS